MKNIKEIVEKYTTNEGIDWEKVGNSINEHVNGIVKKQTEKEKEQTAEQVRTDLFNGLGIEGVEDEKALKTRLKALSDGEAALKKQIEETNTKYGELEKQYESATKTTDTLTKERTLLEMGLTDPDDRDYVMVNVMKRMSEDKDFDTALEEYKEEKPRYFVPAKPSTTGSRTGGKTVNDDPAGGLLSELTKDGKNPELKSKD